MSILRIVLRIAAPVPKIENYNRFLFIGPHPDDIEIGAGATAARLAREGKEVCFLVCTDGRFGGCFCNLRGDEMAKCRRQEGIASAKRLGVTDVRYLNFCDGGFYNINDMIDEIAKVVGSFKPDVIFAPDPCVTCESHDDHLNVGMAARRIAYFAPYPSLMEQHSAESADVKALAYYYTAKVNHFVGTRGYLNDQLDAIFACHKSQFPENGAEGNNIALYLKLRSLSFGLRSFKGRAEGFRVLSQTHMHCFPEGGN